MKGIGDDWLGYEEETGNEIESWIIVNHKN